MKMRLLQTLGLLVVAAALFGAPRGSEAQTGIVCTNNAQCPPGTLCCYPCGHPGCQDMCLTPFRGGCPHIP